ncbi:CobD/CbiB family protein [Paraburkholderia sp. CNPSo 3272]|uniref:CobD/CbiB family protein n=1 Tax=Paraburkholderia sp. CNPSo 3272 TaxID=2940931 RepID=UPI0020B88C9A|nr:CobD/CbiB family protein [Paraburkholderia sp. CNPSo 3272]MCP3723848.1 CobD/CbiB family protein [Paraburkholderia sp. CNPSo 3272]
MTFFSVLLALVIEQVRALSPNNPVMALVRLNAEWAAHGFDAGKQKHGLLAWLVVVLPWTLATALVYYVLYHISFVLAFLWNVVVVYFTLGFRQFSHYFTDIHLALNNDDVPRAREILHEWTGIDAVDMPVSEIVRHTLIHAVIASHRHVFGVFFWFLVPIGPAGAVLYRIAEYLAREWARPAEDRTEAFSNFAQHVFFVIDWVPARLTSLGFAIVGNFEDAIYSWRNHTNQWPDTNEGVLLATGSGALGARLSGPLAEQSSVDVLAQPGEGGPYTVGDDCTPRTLQSAVGLVWRAVILWMILLLMLTIAVWL